MKRTLLSILLSASFAFLIGYYAGSQQRQHVVKGAMITCALCDSIEKKGWPADEIIIYPGDQCIDIMNLGINDAGPGKFDTSVERR